MFPYTPSGMSPQEIIDNAIDDLAWALEEGVIVEVAEYEPAGYYEEFE